MSRRCTPLTALAGAVCAFALGISSQAAALSPPPADKAEIIYSNGGRIVSMAPDGSNRKVLTRKNAWVGQSWGLQDVGPTVSPDGNSILFNRYYDGFEDGVESGLMIMDRDGSDLRKLLDTPEDGEIFAGTWTPDGDRIVLIDYTESSTGENVTGTSTVFTVKLDGSDRRTILSSTFVYSEKNGKGNVTGQRWLPVAVTPDPDGSRLLVTTTNFFSEKPARLEWVNLETGARSIFENSASSPAFSPDGGQVTFDSDRDGINVSCYEGNCSGDSQIFIKDVSSGAVTRLLPGKPVGSNGGTQWSRDGSRIAFTSTRSPGRSNVGAEIWSVAPDGTCLVRLTNGSPDSSDPQWLPGGMPEFCSPDAPEPLAEITLDKYVLELKVPVLWAGQSFGGQLLSDSLKDGTSLFTSYTDCGRTDGDCMPVVAMESGQICSRSLVGDLVTGRYLGMETIRGGLLVRNTNRNGSSGSSFYAGGLETAIHVLGRKGDPSVGFGYHRRLIGQLRPAGQVEPAPGGLGEIILPWSAVRKSRTMLRLFRETRSLRVASKRAGLFVHRGFVGVAYSRKGANAWLRFGRDLKRLGKVKTVKCKRWRNLPDTIDIRSRLRELTR